MKVLLINGSPRKSGNTFTALTEIGKQLEKQGLGYEIIWIGNKPVRGCIACNKCKETGIKAKVYMYLSRYIPCKGKYKRKYKENSLWEWQHHKQDY